MADAELAAGVVVAGCGFGSGGVRDGGSGAVWERPVGSVVVVDGDGVASGRERGRRERGSNAASPSAR